MHFIFEILATVLMVFNTIHVIYVYISIKKKNKELSKKMTVIGRLYIILLVCFVIGYIAISINNKDNNSIQSNIISQILFWGAVFVTISVHVFKRLYKLISQELYSEISDLKVSLDTYIRSIPGGVHHCVVSPEPRVTYVSKGFTDITGFTIEDINDMYNGKYIGFVYEEDMDTFVTAIKHMLKGMSTVSVSYRIKNKRGDIIWLSDCMNLVRDSKGELHVFAVVMDITQEKNHAEKDSLTGLLNKGAFNEKTREYMHTNPDRYMGLFMVDLNFFKEVNDNYGHQCGDMILVEAAKCLNTIFRDKDAVIGRVGGDEFMILVKNIETEDVVSNLRNNMKENLKLNISTIKDFPEVSASIGYAFAKCTDDFEQIYRKADFSMYEEKEAMHAVRKNR